MNKDFYWYWLNNILGIGRVTIRKLLEEFETPENIFNAEERDISMILQKNDKEKKFFLSKNEESIFNGLARLTDKKIRFIHPDSDDYPSRLKVIPDAPYGLYLKGFFPDENKKSVAIIGARNCTIRRKRDGKIFWKGIIKIWNFSYKWSCQRN